MNIEHRTFNVEHSILMALRFIYFKTSESQIFEGQIRLAQFFYKMTVRPEALDRPFETKAHDRQNSLFDVGRSMFDVH